MRQNPFPPALYLNPQLWKLRYYSSNKSLLERIGSKFPIMMIRVIAIQMVIVISVILIICGDSVICVSIAKFFHHVEFQPPPNDPSSAPNSSQSSTRLRSRKSALQNIFLRLLHQPLMLLYFHLFNVGIWFRCVIWIPHMIGSITVRSCQGKVQFLLSYISNSLTSNNLPAIDCGAAQAKN